MGVTLPFPILSKLGIMVGHCLGGSASLQSPYCCLSHSHVHITDCGSTCMMGPPFAFILDPGLPMNDLSLLIIRICEVRHCQAPFAMLLSPPLPSWDVQKSLDPCFRLTRSPSPHPSQQPILPSALNCFHVLLLLFMHFFLFSPWSGDKTGEGGWMSAGRGIPSCPVSLSPGTPKPNNPD
jgi:hypothetical protein